MSDYRVKYTVYLKDSSFTNRETIVKNCFTAAHAMVKLEKYLIKKEPNFDRMHVYYCKTDPSSWLLFNAKSNPFV